MKPARSRWTFGCASLLVVWGCSSTPAASNSQPLAGAVTLQIGPGPDLDGGAGTCSEVPIPFSIERSPNGFPANLLGANDASVASRLSCDVRAEGATYAIDLDIALGPTAGFSLSGQMASSAIGVEATFERDGRAYSSQASCAVSFTEDDEMDVAPGRVWAFVTCPEVSDGQGHVCFASAEFVFVGCTQ